VSARDALRRLVTAYVQRTGSFDFQAEQATALMRDFREVWLSPTIRHAVIVPLLSFEMDDEAISLDDSLMLVRLSADMKRGLYRPPAVFMDESLTARDLATAGGALAATYDSADPRDPHPCQQIWLRVVRALRALRLLRPGTACPGVWYDRIIPPDLCDGSSEQHIGDWRPNVFGRTPYQLRSEDVSLLRELYDALTMIEVRPVPHGLEEPLREFERTYGHLHVEEQIKALGTVFETALMADRPKVKGGRKSEVLAPRGARLVAATYNEATSAIVLRTCYRVRNRLTHEGKTLRECADVLAPVGMSPLELVSRSFELARAVLTAFVRQLAADDTVTARSIAAELGRETGT
jgi:hypothetical protein